MEALSSLFRALTSTGKQWLKVEDKTGNPEFWNDLQSLFERAMNEGGQTAGAAMYRVAAPESVFYFSPNAANIVEAEISFIEGDRVTIQRCSKPPSHKVVFLVGDPSQ
ncbi:hypothetical protein FJW07_06775 [Mesorhizobium sp. B3-1-9]|uniref:hypothetical protein n=1 Tax=unclassified Mesorhizobium TaxID=325217 RepID=UPI00112C4B94|nr:MULTISPECIES: hypothetical protein [unclassified Mesorhizobium]TPI40963.1 hypothetical protein FJW07_06775 [Mesorhizobium sp. B3-1-9]UCI24570.1 hypothetical protein FJ430_23695 [Mesorhizobium sp. B2-8-5]